jgi:hypothetical protein
MPRLDPRMLPFRMFFSVDQPTFVAESHDDPCISGLALVEPGLETRTPSTFGVYNSETV